jgi:hypothetical protein
MATKAVQKNPADITLRNLRALRKDLHTLSLMVLQLRERVARLEKPIKVMRPKSIGANRFTER